MRARQVYRLRRRRWGELLEADVFRSLDENDILFVDSGHTVRTGGEANRLVLDVLPVLAPGVVVPSHNIPLPYEYAEVYFTNSQFRMFWREAYLLQAIRCHNAGSKVLLATTFLMRGHAAAFQSGWPHHDPRIHRSSRHNFWTRHGR